jgi:hypothetical protein
MVEIIIPSHPSWHFPIYACTNTQTRSCVPATDLLASFIAGSALSPHRLPVITRAETTRAKPKISFVLLGVCLFFILIFPHLLMRAVLQMDCIVRVKDCVILVLKYFEHEPFSDYMGTMSLPQIRAYMRALMEALAHVVRSFFLSLRSTPRH